MKVSKNSWHYNLYRMGNNGPFEYRVDWKVNKVKDLCQYTRNILLGLLASLILVIMGTIISILLLDFPITVLMYIFTDNSWTFFLSEGSNIIGMALYGFVSIILLMFYGIQLYKKTEEKYDINISTKISKKVGHYTKKSETLTLFKTMYKSFKEKTCVLIEVKD